MPSANVSDVIGIVVRVGGTALILKRVYGIAENQAANEEGREFLRAQEIPRRQIETAPHFVHQSRARVPTPGRGEKMRVVQVGYRGGDGVIVCRVGAIDNIPVPQVGRGESVLGRQVVVAADGQVVPSPVIPSGERISGRVPQQRRTAVSRTEIVDLVRSGNLTDQALNYGIERHAGRLQNIDLPHRSGLVAIRENAPAGCVGQDGSIRPEVLPVPEGLVVGVEEQLVLDDVSAQSAAELILVQERLGNSILVVEPGAGGERIVAVVPIGRAVIDVPAGRSGQRNLRGSAPHSRVRVGSRDRELGDLIHHQQVGMVSQAVAAQEIILNVDAVQRDVAEGRSRTVNDHVADAAAHPGLRRDERHGIAVERGKAPHLLVGDGGRHFRVRGLDRLHVGRHIDGLSHRRQLELHFRQRGFARRVHPDAAQRILEKPRGFHRHVVGFRPNVGEAVQPFGSRDRRQDGF